MARRSLLLSFVVFFTPLSFADQKTIDIYCQTDLGPASEFRDHQIKNVVPKPKFNVPTDDSQIPLGTDGMGSNVFVAVGYASGVPYVTIIKDRQVVVPDPGGGTHVANRRSSAEGKLTSSDTTVAYMERDADNDTMRNVWCRLFLNDEERSKYQTPAAYPPTQGTPVAPQSDNTPAANTPSANKKRQ